jgi:hypothetical protein
LFDGVNMRKSDAVPVAARTASASPGTRSDTPIDLICGALALALLVLAVRIVVSW